MQCTVAGQCFTGVEQAKKRLAEQSAAAHALAKLSPNVAPVGAQDDRAQQLGMPRGAGAATGQGTGILGRW